MSGNIIITLREVGNKCFSYKTTRSHMFEREYIFMSGSKQSLTWFGQKVYQVSQILSELVRFKKMHSNIFWHLKL